MSGQAAVKTLHQSEKFHRFVLDRDTPVPDHVLHQAKRLMLDTLGVAAGAIDLRAGVIGRDTAVELYAAPDDQAVPILFDHRRASLPGALFAAATQIDNLDAHDGYNLTKGHIGVVIVPTVLALAHRYPEMTGRDLLSAMVMGYEIAGRAGRVLHATVSDYHTSGAWNALGVAAVAARFMGFDAEKLRQALGIAEYHGPRSQMMREIDHPTMLHDGSSWGALAGMTAALMADKGFRGAPAITVEAPDVQNTWDDLGEHWLIMDQYVKPYPICRWAHAAIEAASSLRQELGEIRPEELETIEIVSFHEGIRLFNEIPASPEQSQYSLAYPVAVMLLEGKVGPEAIAESRLSELAAGQSDWARACRSVIGKMVFLDEDRFNERFPQQRWAEVALNFRDGSRVASGEKRTRGDGDAPFSDEEMLAKYRHYSAPNLGTERSEAIADAVMNLDQGHVAELLRLLEG
ncbi:MmgE/PrpD family protein [Kiloniella sp. b19]|uniref:MmgE/PrpD family protein n=1 Tax=Kiloniella sp. GXU_MW_B19 TaxID=3141326 RepID=UPI0031E12893